MARTKQKCRRNNQNVSDNHGEGSSTGARPGFTMEEYNRRIQEQENGYPDVIVTEERVLRFIDIVAKRGNSGRPRGDGSNFGYSYHNLAQYLSAMVDLHKKQRNDSKNRYLNMNPILRGPAIKQLDQHLEIESRINNANDLEDSGENSIQDGYTFEQMILMSQNHLNAEKPQALLQLRI
ncbi:hypothetical protein [Parasitella parasitica]|uniref:Uncharacterized protein n=1 Tax=Parasitella parasitica TaxID=35722 RepID=A0A0B7NWX1_9FUNG|nr:hypothetical protein [Parasitella parasitica]